MNYFKQLPIKRWQALGAPWIGLSASMLVLCLLLTLGLFLLIGYKGLSHFWPQPIMQWTVMATDHNLDTSNQADNDPNKAQTIIGQAMAIQDDYLVIKIANRELNNHDFLAVLQDKIVATAAASHVAIFERDLDGVFFGTPLASQDPQSAILSQQDLEARMSKIQHLKSQLRDATLSLKKQNMQSSNQSAKDREILNQTRQALNQELDGLDVWVKTPQGNMFALSALSILDAWYPNQMTTFDKVARWGVQVGKFFRESPRESNSEGGVLPAIFGTVLLVLLMSIVVMPLGVLAAIYLHEYAKNNWLTRLIHISVVNLAGVPSIVYGVFGLGFFVYTLGGSLDSLLFDDPATPILGSPGLLWSAWTLALLTVPVVIVATEEGLSRIPKESRHASYALGATQFETLTRIVLPSVSPAIITGLILAIARAAGEVAPLMLVGVVKYASNLPIDDQFPYLHLDRQFMHLGFHIYDVAFQSRYVEAGRSLVYATALLLILVVAGLNFIAILIRSNLKNQL